MGDKFSPIELLDRACLKKIVSYVLMTVADVPVNFNEAISFSKAEYWKAAMKEVFAVLVNSNKVFMPTILLQGKKSHWQSLGIHKKDGSLNSFHTRLVARGFLQKFDWDCFESFCPETCWDTVRALISYVSVKGLNFS